MAFTSRGARFLMNNLPDDFEFFNKSQHKMRQMEGTVDPRCWSCCAFTRHQHLLELMTEKTESKQDNGGRPNRQGDKRRGDEEQKQDENGDSNVLREDAVRSQIPYDANNQPGILTLIEISHESGSGEQEGDYSRPRDSPHDGNDQPEEISFEVSRKTINTPAPCLSCTEIIKLQRATRGRVSYDTDSEDTPCCCGDQPMPLIVNSYGPTVRHRQEELLAIRQENEDLRKEIERAKIREKILRREHDKLKKTFSPNDPPEMIKVRRKENKPADPEVGRHKQHCPFYQQKSCTFSKEENHQRKKGNR